MGNRSIQWSKSSIKQFEAAIKYIASDSVKNAEKVFTVITKQLVKAAKNAEFFPPDKYKKNNDGSYRAFEKHRYRIAYRFTDNSILVLRIRHTSREPREY
ncbi:MAG: type II toxin-antitoxin system RelE/ParE family toxin [Chitinophagaceae bacterium]